MPSTFSISLPTSNLIDNAVFDNIPPLLLMSYKVKVVRISLVSVGLTKLLWSDQSLLVCELG